MKIKNLSRNSVLAPKICVGLLGVLAIAMLCPITNNIPEANAEGERLASSLTLSLTGGDASQTTQADAGAVAFRTNTFQVSATSYLNYDIYVSGLSGQSANLTGRDSAQTIGKVAANTATSSFANNTWGYSITTNTAAGSETSLNYNPVPEFSNSVPSALHYNMKEDTENNNYKLAFAALIAPGMPVDHYETNVMLSVVGNPGEIVRDLTGITTMQEMTAEICSKSTEGQTKQLKDSRDGNLYWVTKLKDGNCWMTQNLDFDIPSTLKASDTDVTSDTTISVTKYTNSNGVGSWGSDNTQTKQYDPGVMYKTNPTGTDYCSGSGITSLTNSACATAGWSTSGSDKHYTIGNYYSWNAATAGTGNSAGSTPGTKAAGSICPKGWHLPTAGTGSYNNKGSFAYLLRQYGFATADNAGNVGTTPNSMVDAPMYWLRGGYVYSTYLGYAGYYGYYWSSNVYSSTNAYVLNFNTGTDLYPSNSSNRYLGFPVRCLAN